jgi:hypothetical protein
MAHDSASQAENANHESTKEGNHEIEGARKDPRPIVTSPTFVLSFFRAFVIELGY